MGTNTGPPATAPFRVLGGAVDSPVILHAPHGGRTIPDDVRAGIVLSDEALAAEVAAMTDSHTDHLAVEARALSDTAPWALVNQCSRLVVDPERFPDEREQMTAVGMGAVYTRTSTGAPLRRDDATHGLLERFFHPYTQAAEVLVDDRVAACGRAVLIDVHSYPRHPLPYERDPTAPRPEICLGVDDTHTPRWLFDAASRAFTGLQVGVNSPFAGCYIPGRHYNRTPNVWGLMVEIRRDLYRSDDGNLTAGYDDLTRRLASLVNEIGGT